MDCKECEYRPVCFDALRILNGIKPGICKQGRHIRVPKPRTLKVIIDAQTNSGTPVSPV